TRAIPVPQSLRDFKARPVVPAPLRVIPLRVVNVPDTVQRASHADAIGHLLRDSKTLLISLQSLRIVTPHFINPSEGPQGVDLESLPAQIRSEEHTSELQSLTNLVCRLLLEKTKKIIDIRSHYNPS